MSRLTQMLKLSAIGLVSLTGLAACHPEYVHERYQETYIPAYGSVAVYRSTPSYSYYDSSPAYVERTTIISPRVVVTQPQVVYQVNRPDNTDWHHVRRDFDEPRASADRLSGNDRNRGDAQSSQAHNRNDAPQQVTSRPPPDESGSTNQRSGRPYYTDRRGPPNRADRND